jgi:DNA-binding response OmpR family regulator
VPRILVVEDEPAIAVPLKGDLELEGYDVEVAADGESAVARAREGSFDLILLDVMLPRKDGFEVCRELRRGGVRTPIILLTARTEEAEKVLGLELGADDYVTKPFSPKELRARIKAMLRRAGGEPAETYRFGEVELDLGRCELRRAGRPVETTPLELKLLALFVRSRGRTLTREQLPAARPGLGPGGLRHGPRRRQPHQPPPPEDRARARPAPLPGEREGDGLPLRRLRGASVVRTRPKRETVVTVPSSGWRGRSLASSRIAGG